MHDHAGAAGETVGQSAGAGPLALLVGERDGVVAYVRALLHAVFLEPPRAGWRSYPGYS